MKERGKGLKYLRYFTLLFGLSLLGFAFIYYMVVLSASLGVLISNDGSNYKGSFGLDFSGIYCNMFFSLFSVGSLGAILTYMGLVIIPKIDERKA